MDLNSIPILYQTNLLIPTDRKQLIDRYKLQILTPNYLEFNLINKVIMFKTPDKYSVL